MSAQVHGGQWSAMVGKKIIIPSIMLLWIRLLRTYALRSGMSLPISVS